LASSYPSQEGVREHDGFYLRLALGIGYLEGRHSYRCCGGTLLVHRMWGVSQLGTFAVGGTLGRGLVLGGGLWGATLPSVTVSGTQENGDANPTFYDFQEDQGVLSTSIVALFLSWYPDPREGWHVSGATGLALVNGERWTRAGVGLVLEGGYDAWVGKQWSLGVTGRVSYLHLGKDDLYSLFVPGLAGTATFH
jgi:hypothetical protein